MKIRRKYTILFLAVALGCGILGLISCVKGQMMERKYETIRESMEPLGRVINAYPLPIREYFSHYALQPEQTRDIEHLFGTFDSNGCSLAGHIYRPASYKGTVILVHGYLNHTGQLAYLIPYLLDHGYAVAAFDLPGHGLSEGERAATDDFGAYRDTLLDFRRQLDKHLNGPFHLVAFSNGASPAIQLMLEGKDAQFDKIVLAAPLVRPVGWKNIKFTYPFYSKLVDSIPRVPRRNAGNEEFIDFNRHDDYLHATAVSVKWVKAMLDWNKYVESLPANNRELLVIQGDRDCTVDYKHNISFLQAKFAGAEIIWISDAKHELLNESRQLREQVFKKITDYIGRA